MAGFNFADNYKAAGLAPGPDIIHLRQKPFDRLRQKLNADRAVDLTRLYFGLPTPAAPDWFRDAFAETDPSFTMVENEREAAVLASCLLAAALEDGEVAAGLAPIVTAAAGNRTPLVRPGFIDEAREELQTIAVGVRRHAAIDPKKITQPAKSKVPEAADVLAAGPDWPKAVALFKQIDDESQAAIRTLADQIADVFTPLVSQVVDLRQEVDMLWWYVSGWSRVLDKPFSELDLPLAAAMAGMDIAALTREPPGPAAAPAILHRLIFAGRNGERGKVAIKDAVHAFPGHAFQRLELHNELKKVPDVCPVLTAFLKASEIGESPAWHGPFKKVAQLDAGTTFKPLELAMQVYREALLIASLD